jgi:hypothetical protein
MVVSFRKGPALKLIFFIISLKLIDNMAERPGVGAQDFQIYLEESNFAKVLSNDYGLWI